jgi:hypothetical protein
MRDVYLNAAHVLVLDQTLLHFSATKTSPADLLMRTFSMSPWSHRLWTLQEGALAQSLYIQFKDKAVACKVLERELYRLLERDPRTLGIYVSAITLMGQVRRFPIQRCFRTGERGTTTDLRHLFMAVSHRAVTVPSDEPLCLATLMGLDAAAIAQVAGQQERMARFWEMWASKYGGIVSSLILYDGETIDMPGWRWAPRNLVSYPSPPGRDESMLSMHVVFGQEIRGKPHIARGFPTPWGFKVALPGYRLVLRRRLGDLPLDLWDGVAIECEVFIPVRHEDDRWSFMMITDDTEQRPRRPLFKPMHHALMSGQCAIITYDPASTKDGGLHRLVKQDGSPGSGKWVQDEPLRVRRDHIVVLQYVEAPLQKALSVLSKLAEEVAADEATTALLQLRVKGGLDREDAFIRVRRRMAQGMRELLDKHYDAGIRATLEDLGVDGEENYWKLIPRLFSYDVLAEGLPDNQIWYVD